MNQRHYYHYTRTCQIEIISTSAGLGMQSNRCTSFEGKSHERPVITVITTLYIMTSRSWLVTNTYPRANNCVYVFLCDPCKSGLFLAENNHNAYPGMSQMSLFVPNFILTKQ